MAIQELVDDIPFDLDEPSSGVLSSIIFALPSTSRAPAWWTPARDQWLRLEWMKHDPLKVAVGTFVDKVASIPFRVVPRDTRVSTHQTDAKLYQNAIVQQSGIMRGFGDQLKKATLDYLTQDNGCFFWVMGNGSRNLIGPSSGLYHLDASLCERTGDPEFPVKYYHTDGKVIDLHYSRVISIAKNPSPIVTENGRGICSVSSCLDSENELGDITNLSSEFMGSRPRRRIVYVKKGATIDQMINALQKSESKMDNAGLSHFAYTTVLAPKVAQQELDIGSIDLTQVPDGFDRRDTTIISMSMIGAAFGLTMADLNINYGVAGQGEQDEVAQRTGRGLGPNSFIVELSKQMDEKMLPQHLRSEFDFRDDEQDEQQALIGERRSLTRDRNLSAGVTNPRIERQKMIRSGEIQEEEFEYAELADGRLVDGTSVLSLFYDLKFSQFLDLGVENPTITSQHNAAEMIDILEAKKINIWQTIQSTNRRGIISMSRASLSALDSLQGQYQLVLDQEMQEIDVEADGLP